MCGVWVALEDIDMQNGPLVYYPGSHKLPVVTIETVAPGPGPEHYPLYEAHIEKLVKDRGLTPHHAVLKKGHCLVWASNLLHGGSVHRDKGRTRHSQVTHYYFEGCQYYQPLSSYGGYRHLKLDDWVR
jgi:ectoine hydroxylase-related dioxygenase (phytanoyl-CoA dioxygenase family)